MLGRIAKPDELNAAMVYLMSEASSYVTGNDILVDGGIIGMMN
jgi:NAD(P)-dependent dehydrogenase (short-subunit alcohol dehydrogenase family)